MKLSARQRKRRAYAQALPRPQRPPRPPRPERKAPAPAPASSRRGRRNTLPPMFYFIFGAFGTAYALYYLSLLLSSALGHHVDNRGKAIPPPGAGLYLVAVLFLLLSVGNILIGLKVRRDRRAEKALTQ